MTKPKAPEARKTEERESLAKAQKAISSGKEDIAVFWLKKWAANDFGHRASLAESAEKAHRAHNLQVAATLLRALVELDARPEYLASLAGVKEDQQEPAAALALYQKLLESQPSLHHAVARIGLMKAQLGHADDAMIALRQSADAGVRDAHVATRIADSLWEKHPELAAEAAAFAVNFATDTTTAPYDCASALRLREWVELRKRNMPIYHADDPARIPFAFAREDAARLYASAQRSATLSDAQAALRVAFTAFAAGDLESAATSHETVARLSPNEISANVHFGEAHFDALKAFDIDGYIATLPSITVLKTASFNDEDVIFISCDGAYLRDFGLPLLRSIAHHRVDAAVHIHLMSTQGDDQRQALALIEKITSLRSHVTAEDVSAIKDMDRMGGLRPYYHAGRFLRFFQFLSCANHRLWLMDADALANQDPIRAFAQLDGFDVGLRIRPARVEPWNQFSACLVAARPTAAAISYFKLAAAYLAHCMMNEGLRWGVDQLALYSAHLHMARTGQLPPTTYFGPLVADVEFQPDGIFWFTAGVKKFSYSKDSRAQATSRFEALLRTFS